MEGSKWRHLNKGGRDFRIPAAYQDGARLVSTALQHCLLRALVALSRQQPARAIAELEPAAYDLASLAGHERFNGSLYTVYVRGLAYLEQRKGMEAAAE